MNSNLPETFRDSPDQLEFKNPKAEVYLNISEFMDRHDWDLEKRLHLKHSNSESRSIHHVYSVMFRGILPMGHSQN